MGAQFIVSGSSLKKVSFKHKKEPSELRQKIIAGYQNMLPHHLLNEEIISLISSVEIVCGQEGVSHADDWFGR